MADELEPREQAETAAAEAEAVEALVEPVGELAVQVEAEPSPGAAAEPGAEYSDTELKAILEAVIYVTEEPLEARQIAQALRQPAARIDALLAELVVEFARPERGLQIREIAGGFKMATKPELHDQVRLFVKNLKPPLKLSLAALETLAVIAYKQPITAPEIMEIRGVQGGGVLKTLLDRKLVQVAGRKNVIGKPILYKTNKEFLVQFGLSSLKELPSLKEFEELRRLAFSEEEAEATAEALDLRDAEAPVEAPEPEAGNLEAASQEAAEQGTA
ncbi:MAG: SMC-Scp complex subunit ScpB [Acidobacteriota bacterium]